MKTEIKKYCKNFNLKFVEMINSNEFITSQKVNVFAGMEFLPGTGKLISIPIKKIGSKLVYEKHLCFGDGDIVGNGKVNYI